MTPEPEPPQPSAEDALARLRAEQRRRLEEEVDKVNAKPRLTDQTELVRPDSVPPTKRSGRGLR